MIQFFYGLFKKKQRRCAERHCWLPATKKHAGHWFCETHHHDYTYDVGITNKKYEG